MKDPQTEWDSKEKYVTFLKKNGLITFKELNGAKIEMAPIIQKTTALNRIAPNASTIPFSENNSLQGS